MVSLNSSIKQTVSERTFIKETEIEDKLKQKSFDLVVREKYNRAMKNAS